MRKWSNSVAPPEGWEVNSDLSHRYGQTMITQTNERARTGGYLQHKEKKQRGGYSIPKAVLTTAGLATVYGLLKGKPGAGR